MKDKTVKNLKPEPTRYIRHDGEGLYIYVQPTGTKTWYYVYKEDGKKKQTKIGNYPAISLSEARELHRNLVRLRERGELDKPALTYKVVYMTYMNEYANTYIDKGTEFKRIHEKDILPYIAEVDITQLSKSHVRPIVSAVIKRGSPRQSNITIEKISRVCRYAVEADYINVNPIDHYPKQTENEPRQRILTNDEIRQVYQERHKSELCLILYIMLCTGQRGGEVKSIRYEDIQRKWWYCKQVKGQKVSVKVVYLPVSVRSFFNQPRTSGRVFKLSEKTDIANWVRRQKRGYTPHDLRRTASTLLVDELDFPDYLVDRFLGHSVSKLKATYIVSKRERDMREMSIMLNKHIRFICNSK